jgi:hypothetical protein
MERADRARVRMGFNHAQLKEAAATLFRALDDRDAPRVATTFSSFLQDLESYLRGDLRTDYEGLLRHSSEFVRRLAERILSEAESFPRAYAELRTRWRGVAAVDLLSEVFRDELETLVSALLKRMRVEERLLAALESVA